MIDLNFCTSSYLTFRFVIKPNTAWKEGITPKSLEVPEHELFGVSTASQTLEKLQGIVTKKCKNKFIGILLSGGVDSAILASLMPENINAYTIKFVADGAIDETKIAKIYAKKLGLNHKIIRVTWNDYLKYSEILMSRCQAPLHPIEIPLYKAAIQAKKDGMQLLICGCGADSRFGGLDKLLSKDWDFEEFIERYTFLKPELVLKSPVSMRDEYAKFKAGDKFNLRKFILEVQNCGPFFNAVEAAGVELLNPYEYIFLEGGWDLKRIRSGESKYVLREAFKKQFPDIEVPEKIAFARPMNIWLKDWKGPLRQEFKENIDMNQFSGDQKWLLFCLEKFLNLIEEK